MPLNLGGLHQGRKSKRFNLATGMAISQPGRSSLPTPGRPQVRATADGCFREFSWYPQLREQSTDASGHEPSLYGWQTNPGQRSP